MNTNSRLKNSVISILTGVGGYALNAIFSFIGRSVFIVTLSSEYLGINGLFSNILNMLSLAELGISGAIVYALYKPLADKDEKQVAALMNFYGLAYKVIGFVVAFIGLALLPFLKTIVGEAPDITENIYLIYLLYLFNTSSTYFFSYKYSLLTADQKYYIVSGCSYISSYITTIIQIIILRLTHNYLLYLIIQFLSVFIYNITLSIITDKVYPFLNKYRDEKIETKTKSSLVKNVKALVVIKLSSMLVNNTDNIIINVFHGLSVTGITSNYTLLSSTVSAVLAQVFNGVTSSVGNYTAQKTDKENFDLFKKLNFLNFWLYGWSCICLVVLSSRFICLLWGEKYVLAINIPIAISINLYILGMQSATWTFKSALGLFDYGKYILLITATLNIFFSLLLGKIWGVFGILIATTISRLCTNVWYEPYAIFKYGIHQKIGEYIKSYFKYLIIEGLSGILTIMIAREFSAPTWTDFLLCCVICILIPNLIFVLCLRKSDEYLYYKGLLVNIMGNICRKTKKSNQN